MPSKIRTSLRARLVGLFTNIVNYANSKLCIYPCIVLTHVEYAYARNTFYHI